MFPQELPVQFGCKAGYQNLFEATACLRLNVVSKELNTGYGFSAHGWSLEEVPPLSV